MKPEGPKNREVKDGFTPNQANFVSWLVAISIIVLIFSLAIITGCATIPQTHEEWATYCMGKDDTEFADCLEAWDAWSK